MLRQVVYLFFLVLGAAVAAARYVDQSGSAVAARPTTAATAVAPNLASASQGSYGSSIVIPPDVQGHFRVDARVDARPMSFMIDTGATVIAMRESDAGALGIHPGASDFKTEVKTANGSTRGAPVELSMVEVGGLMVRDVQALVLPNVTLGENLLGLSFLRRLRRFEYANGRLVLEQ